MKMAERPNIQEFSTIASLILADLFESHPIRQDISSDKVMAAMGIAHPMSQLESGQMFKEMFGATIDWLVREGFVHSVGITPPQRAVLTTKALAAMNAMPPSLGGRSIAQSISETNASAATGEGRSKIATIIGDFIGSAAGSFTKSVGTGS